MAATMEQRLETNPGQNSSLDSYFLRLSLNNTSSSNPHHNLHNNSHLVSHLSHQQHQSLQDSSSDFQTPLIQITPSGANNTSNNSSQGTSSSSSTLSPQSSSTTYGNSYLLKVPSELDVRSNCTFLQVPQQDLSKLAVMPQD